MNPDQFFQDSSGNWQVRQSFGGTAGNMGLGWHPGSSTFMPTQPSFTDSIDTVAANAQMKNDPLDQHSVLHQSIDGLISQKMRAYFEESYNGRSSETKGYWGLDIKVKRSFDMEGNRVMELPDPVHACEAATKGYVDELIEAAVLRAKEELKKEFLADTTENLKIRVRRFSLLETEEK